MWKRAALSLFCSSALGSAALIASEELPESGYETKLFDELDDRTLSRRGETALQMESVDWQHGESRNFVFHFEKGFLCHQLAASAEAYYRQIKRHLQIEEDSFERKSHIYVFLAEKSWDDFIGTTTLDPWTGGFCTGTELFFPSRVNPKFQGSTLPHEMTHLAIHRFIQGDVPLWLEEGMAEFIGRRLSVANLKKWGIRGVHGADRVARDKFIPLRELTAAVDYPSDDDKVETFYNQSQRLVHFLHHKSGGMASVVKLLRLQGQGRRFESALQEIFGEKFRDIDELEAEFIPYATTENSSGN